MSNGTLQTLSSDQVHQEVAGRATVNGECRIITAYRVREVRRRSVQVAYSHMVEASKYYRYRSNLRLPGTCGGVDAEGSLLGVPSPIQRESRSGSPEIEALYVVGVTTVITWKTHWLC
jgi:hypothetical protein